MKKVICLILVLLMSSVSVYADGLNVSFDTTNGFTITGQAPENSKAMIMVKKPGTADYSTVDNIFYANWAPYSEAGFTFNIPVAQAGEGGIQVAGYNMRVTFENNKQQWYTYLIKEWNISNFAIGDDNKSASVTLSSGTGAALDCPVLLVAVYEKDTDRCVGVAFDTESTTVTSVDLSAEVTGLPDNFNADNYYAKAFIWNNLNKMSPLTNAIDTAN